MDRLLRSAPSIRDVSAKIRGGEISAEDFIQACLRQQASLSDRLNAFASHRGEDDLLSSARSIDEALRSGKACGALAGIPIALKDMYCTADQPTTASSRVLRDWRPEHDAAVTARLRQAGAVITGKTQTHEFAYGLTTVNEHAGPSRNPWDTDRIPGGSSGGSAIAVATSMCLGAAGTDTAGSIRIPSALCGISGLKPTYGLVSRFGVLPLSWSLDHAGPMARSVDDLAFLLHAMAGHDARDPGAAVVSIPDYPARIGETPTQLRLGLPRDYFFDVIDPEVRRAFDAALETLQGMGWSVDEISLPTMKYAAAAEFAIVFAEAAAYHRRRMVKSADLYSADVRSSLDAGMVILASDYLQGQRARRLIMEDFSRALRQVDVLVTPTLPVTALRIDERYVEIGGSQVPDILALWRNVFPANLAGLPSLSVPCGFSRSGLPIGLQLIGRAFDELTVLQAGHAYQQVTDWHRRIPTIAADA